MAVFAFRRYIYMSPSCGRRRVSTVILVIVGHAQARDWAIKYTSYRERRTVSPGGARHEMLTGISVTLLDLFFCSSILPLARVLED